ncbi:hypothetical protein LOTGIDRAFT_233972 [Lottia gigantea]|uniref:Uncharacterized protein n=1 Tax=Lottia gigantea TaxID=225164 RepID=V4BMK6_LOTGI|nr:hypothetical protein LOTGIDRAFT_233972 [Lottia gigantea]ESO90179.1 hypothetical protein LOTGIDRAFT_233972 [Lottia gigantea]
MRLKQNMNTVAALKGNLGLRSSPLSPTASKLSTQYLVLDHMSNHYKKISKAKSAIDSKPPKSMVNSQKARDNQRRKEFEKYGRSRSCTSLSRHTPTPGQQYGYTEDMYDETLWDDPEDEEDELVQSIMRTTLQTQTMSHPNKPNMEKTLQHHQDLHHSNAMATTMRPISSRSARSCVSNVSRLSEVTRKSTYDGDVVDKHQHRFTEPNKPFTPRTLKSNRQSKLSQYKYYTPPKNKRPSSSRSTRAENDTMVKTQESPRSPEKPRVKPRKSSVNQNDTFTDTHMFESLQSHDFQNYKNPSDVPPLEITVDKDHKEWLEDQVDKAKQRLSDDDDEF